MRLSISSKARRRTWRGGIALFVLTCVAAAASAAAPRPWLDVSASFEQRAAALVAQMTLEEKAAQMQNAAPAIERLGVPAYDWWNEGLHGVARAGQATVFPQAIGLAATFDVPLMGQVATTISDEARAKHHQFLRGGAHGRYQGVTFWSPNVNIFRDPRWGRGQETYGEDPYLTARMGVASYVACRATTPSTASWTPPPSIWPCTADRRPTAITSMHGPAGATCMTPTCRRSRRW